MDDCLIVCEFNPFHKGHEYLIKEVKKHGLNIICLMSGNITQRGELSVISKYDKAESALRAGADLVIEYPYPFCASDAGLFAENAIFASKMMNVVNCVAFGSEINDISVLKETVDNISNPDFEQEVKDRTRSGERYTNVIKNLYIEKYGKTPLFDNSNDILNLEYLKAVKKFGLSYNTISVKRVGEQYNSVDNDDIFASASHIRNDLQSGNTDRLKISMPEYSFKNLIKQLDTGMIYDEEKYYDYIRLFFKSFNNEENQSEFNNEIFNRIKNSLEYSLSFSDFLENASNKIYSKSKIRRSVIHLITGVKNDNNERPKFIQILGFNEVGRKIIKDIKKTGNIPVITKQADYIEYGIEEQYKRVMLIDNIWENCLKTRIEFGYNFKHKPIII